MAQTSLGQTLAQTLLDLEDGLGWDQVKSSFSYKQRAWVNAVERLVATPDLELSVLQELTLQLYTAVKPAALYYPLSSATVVVPAIPAPLEVRSLFGGPHHRSPGGYRHP